MSIPSTSPTAHLLEIPESFTLRLLDAARERNVLAKSVRLIGRRLIVQVPEFLTVEECVRIDCPTGLVLGDVLGCWQEKTEVFAAIELKECLRDFPELASNGWVPQDRSTALRKRA